MVLNSIIVKLHYPPDYQLHLRRMNNLIYFGVNFFPNEYEQQSPNHN